jgi:hypothetical protein
MKETKNSEIDVFEFLNFVLFVTFVAQWLFRFCLRFCSATGAKEERKIRASLRCRDSI